jgi:hypothetical protein
LSSRLAESSSSSSILAESCFSMASGSAFSRLGLGSVARPRPISFGNELGSSECRVLDSLAVERPDSGIGTAPGVGRLSFIASSIFARSPLASEWQLTGRESPTSRSSVSASGSGRSSSSLNRMLRRMLSISESLKPLSYIPITSSRLGPSSTEVGRQLLRA